MSQITKFNSGVLNFSASGDNTAVAAVAGHSIIVWKMLFTTAAAVNVTFKDGAATTLSGALIFGGNGSVFFAYDGSPYYSTSIGNAFVINLSGAVGIAGTVYYTIG